MIDLQTINLYDHCVYCATDTFRSGLVNRIPADRVVTIEMPEVAFGQDRPHRIEVRLDGYMCPDCQEV